MRRFTAIVIVIFSFVLTTSMIVKSNHKFDDNAEDLMRILTPDVLISRCGQPAADIASRSNRQMFYPNSKDMSIGLIFSFVHTPGDPNWIYSSFHVGTPKGKGLMALEDFEGSNSWAIIALPCLDARRQGVTRTMRVSLHLSRFLQE